MIIQYFDTGEIYHVMSEPSDAEVITNLLKQPNTMHLPIVAGPIGPVIDPATGEQLIVNDVPIEAPAFYDMPECGMATHYVKDGEVVERPKIDGPVSPVMIKADGKDKFDMECDVISIDGQVYPVTGGSLTFVTTEPGTYVFQSVFPYQPLRFEVVAK